MAELLLKVGAGAGYEDGDIVCAFNDLSVQNIHAQHICHPWKATVNTDGLLDAGTVIEDYYKRVSQYKFKRISATEVRRTDLETSTSETLSSTPNANGEAIDVALFLSRRKAHKASNNAPKMPLFGSEGSEIWYGGNTTITSITVDLVWQDIEAKTVERKSSYPDWPLTDTEKKHFLVVPTLDFDQQKQAELIEPEYDTTDPGNPILVRKRKRKIDYTNDLTISGDTLAKISDRDTIVEKPKSTKYDIDLVVATKK